MVNYKINVYLKHTEMENMYVREFIELVTQDVNGNTFEFTVYEDDNVYDLTNKRVTMVVKSDSGTVIQENCQVVDAKLGKATITLPPDMLIENGPYMAEVQIWEGVNSRVTTLPFDYTVRLSLENDESIKADPRFSLLQVALKNVNDADNKSKEALKLSKEAKAICDDLVPKANTAAQNAQTALDRAESVVTQEELAQKVMLDGKDTKVDFIENKVVQEGLVGCFSSDKFNNTEVNLSTEFTYIIKHKNLKNWSRLMNTSSSRALIEVKDGTSGDSRLYFPLEDENITEGIKTNPSGGVVVATCINGLFEVRAINSLTKRLTKTTYVTLIKPLDVLYDAVLIYNRVLTPQEIQHNLSVINNYPAIKEIRTTDAEGKTSILKLASSEEHVEMSTGRTLREEYMGVLKTMGEEFVSTDGSPITVNNGIEARVINTEISGRTVKNYAKTIERSSFSSVTGQTKIDDMNNIITIDTPTEYSNCFLKKGVELLPNTTYKVVLIILENTLSGPFSINNGAHSGTVFSGNLDLPKGSTGVKEFTFTTKSDVSGDIILRMFAGVGSGSIKLQAMVVDENATTPTSYIPFGLSSTEAIISNSGKQYPIYEPTIQGKTRILKAPKGTQNWVEINDIESRDTTKFDYKLESINGDLGSVPSASDYVDRASKIRVINTKEIVLNGYESDWSIRTDGGKTNTLLFKTVLSDALPTDMVTYVSNIFGSFSANAIWSGDFEGISINTGKMLDIRISKTKLATQDLSGFKQWLKSNPITVRYQLATSIQTQATEEQRNIYEAYKEVISLDVVGDKRNTLDIKEDGSAIYTQNVLRYLIDGTSKNRIRLENTSIIIDGSKGILGYSGYNNVVALLSSRLTPASWNNGYSTEGAIYMHPNGALFISNTESKTLEEVKLDLSSNPIEVIGFIPSPIITHIPKELVTSILTHKTNIWEVGGAVKASSFKIVQPVDAVGELRAEINEIKKQLGAVAALQLDQIN